MGGQRREQLPKLLLYKAGSGGKQQPSSECPLTFYQCSPYAATAMYVFLLNQVPRLEVSPVDRSNWAFLQNFIFFPICSVVLSQALPWPSCADPGKRANQAPFSLPNDFPKHRVEDSLPVLVWTLLHQQLDLQKVY